MSKLIKRSDLIELFTAIGQRRAGRGDAAGADRAHRCAELLRWADELERRPWRVTP